MNLPFASHVGNTCEKNSFDDTKFLVVPKSMVFFWKGLCSAQRVSLAARPNHVELPIRNSGSKAKKTR